MPGHKPGARRKKPAEQEKKPRKKRQPGFARQRMEPGRRVVHAPESCPECHTTLSGGWVQRTGEVIDIPVVPAEVTEHVFIARTCPLCRKRRLPQDSLKGLAVGRLRLGVNLSSLIVTLREEARLRSAVPAPPVLRGCSAYTSRFWTLRAWVEMKFRRGSTTSPISRVNTPSAWAASSTSTLSICLPSGSMVVSQS